MREPVPVLKDEEAQTPIPSLWRSALSEVVDAFRAGDYQLERSIASVRSISPEDAKKIEKNIASYGANLVSLPEKAWATSVCQWMRLYWNVLVDLYTVEGASDLVLAVRVYEINDSYVFEIQSVHVP